MLACWVVADITLAGAVWFSVWGAQQGLAGNFAADVVPSAPRKGSARFGKDPLYGKEFLWFIRDRSAIVQNILIPLTIASVQVFNMRGLLSQAQGAWNYLCGAGILFGTYFLWILGPKSLTSEGPALWIADVASRSRTLVEGQGLAVVADLVGNRGFDSVLRRVSVSRRHLENRTRWSGVVLL
jgi:hypothetical protein